MPHVDIPFPYSKLPDYPDLRPHDVHIWEAFIDKNPLRFRRVWYNFLVGDHSDPGHVCVDCDKTGATDLLRWAPDVIAEDDEALYVIELKPHAGANALGQAVGYAKLYRDEHQPKKPVVPVVITDLIIGNTLTVARAMGVELWEV